MNSYFLCNRPHCCKSYYLKGSYSILLKLVSPIVLLYWPDNQETFSCFGYYTVVEWYSVGFHSVEMDKLD